MPSTTRRRPAAARVAPAVDPAEAERLRITEARRERYREAVATYNRLAVESQEALTARQIESRWRAGDETPTAAEHAAAQSAHKRYELLVNSAWKRVQSTEARLIPGDLSLALATAGALSTSYGFECETAASTPTLGYTEGDRPQFVVVQIGECVRNDAGGLAGKVQVHLLRADFHRALDAADLMDRLEKSGWKFPREMEFEAVSSGPIEGGEVDELLLTVGVGHAATPVIDSGADLSGTGDGLAGAVRIGYEDAIRRHGERLPRVEAHSDGPALVESEETTGDERTVILVSKIVLAHRNLDASSAIATVGQVVGSLVGRYVLAGRVVAAQVIEAGPVLDDTGEHVSAIGAVVRLSAVSRIVPAAEHRAA